MSQAVTTAEQYAAYLLSNYAPPALFLKRGEGDCVWDENDRRFLDFTSGIAVNTLGHCHPAIQSALNTQASQLIHCSNLFGHRGQGLLAGKVVESIGPGRVFFCNSGAEANEALLKLSRLFGREKASSEGTVFQVVVAANAFHGRTFGGLSATPQAKVQNGFAPLLPGFQIARLNDIESFRQAITSETSAVFLETIQGEGGVFPADIEFLRQLRALCDEKGVLLMLDEVQSGMGRSGWMWAFERAGILPDAVGMAKGIGGGFPLGAIWVASDYASLFQPGSHGTTYGGSPLAAAVSLAVWNTIEEEGLLSRVTQLGEQLNAGLTTLVQSYPDLLAEVRGLGFLQALVFRQADPGWVTRFREEGLLLAAAGQGAVRFLPALTVSEAHLREALEMADRALARFSRAST